MGMSSKQVSSDHLELNWTQNMLGSSETNNHSSNPRSTPIKRPPQPDPLKCPRCESTNTKFCYYNNYNKTQPRHFCKACKRHWTKGGTLRNVPVGGGRKNKRVKRSNGGVTAAAAATVDRHHNSLGLSHDQKYLFSDDKGLFFKTIDHSELGKGVLESYTDNLDRVSWDFNGGFANPTTNMQQLPDHQNLGFSSMLSNLSSIDTNQNPIISTSFSPLLSGFKEDSTTRSMIMPNTTTSSIAINVSNHQPWMQVPSTSNFLESNYWNWNDIDSMVQADLNKPFEDPQVKP
ncbi:hypothetical protein L6452_35432 [Arctium lappa]|uniref:Uncharacterized protein n=1 Tax=Arctium lappa TaxID=4217 RepID=A0ACB8Y6J2_ARCLA|nr:hypothetical protein L6452_35432 [Arctium lappa]